MKVSVRIQFHQALDTNLQLSIILIPAELHFCVMKNIKAIF
jgi:hypothetical protein